MKPTYKSLDDLLACADGDVYTYKNLIFVDAPPMGIYKKSDHGRWYYRGDALELPEGAKRIQ